MEHVGALGLCLADAALVGRLRCIVGLGQQVDQFPDLGRLPGQLLLGAGDAAAVDWIIQQQLHRRRDPLDHRIRLELLLDGFQHGVVDPACRNFLALTEPVQASIHALVPFTRPRRAVRRLQ
ncbi:MAG: hypothetical protein WBG17_14080 [Burkholderiaceae bacterium]